MRYIRDGDVRSLIDRVGPLPPARACALIAQAASALDAAHARGLVHRDVKPTNMLLEISPRTSRPDHLYLSDFGLAKPSAASGLTATGQFFGTVDYVAPEQIQGDPLDGRTDQYALACAAFEMLSGSPPFQRENGMAVISAQLSAPPPSLSARVPGLPAAADRVIARALAKSPADRYDRCLDFAEALLAACGPEAAGAGVGLAGIPYSPTRAAMPMTPATAADAGGPGPAQPPSATPGSPAADVGHPAADDGYPAAGTGYPAAGAGFPAASADYLSAGTGYPAAGVGYSPPPPAGFPPQPPIRTGFPPPPAEPDPATLRWSGQPDPGHRGGRDRRRSRGAFTAGLVAALLVLFFAAAGVTYLVLHNTHGTGSAAGSGAAAGSSAPSVPASSAPTARDSSSTVPAPPSPPPPGVLAATVRAYYAAINHHRYARAWRLGGRNTGQTYHAFVSGFAGTAHDTVTIQSVSGDVVTAQLVAQQTNGTVKTYQGSYTVEGGVITPVQRAAGQLTRRHTRRSNFAGMVCQAVT
jgi:serine/threonine-protein kinase